MERPTNEYLLDRFGKVAGFAAVPYVSRNPHFASDLMSEADMAIFVAADRFDWAASKDCYGFAAHLKIVVKEMCLEFLSDMAYTSTGSRRSLSREGMFHGRGPLEHADNAQGFQWDFSSDSELVEAVRDAASKVLTVRQFEAFARYYFDGLCSDTYVAEMLGVDQSNATKLRLRAEQRIMDYLR